MLLVRNAVRGVVIKKIKGGSSKFEREILISEGIENHVKLCICSAQRPLFALAWESVNIMSLLNCGGREVNLPPPNFEIF